MMAKATPLARVLLAIVLFALCMLNNASAQTTSVTPGGEAVTAVPPPDELFNSALYVAQSVPTSMVTGGVYSVTINMYNNGTIAWAPGYGYSLGSTNPNNNSTWSVQRVAVAGTVGVRQATSFTFQVTAPATPGVYNFQFQMLQEGVEWFGSETPNVAVTVTAPSPLNGAQLIGQSVASTMTQGSSYPVSISLRNSGNTTWPAGSVYRLGSRNPENNTIWGWGRIALTSQTPPGGTANFAFQVVAPAAGSYNMQWQMLQESVEWFGDISSAAITVQTPALVNHAQVGAASAPSPMTQGGAYTASVTMVNSGTTTWIPGSYFLGSQNPLDNQTWNNGRVSLGNAVAPGASVTFAIPVVAPAAGNYSMQWKMLQSGVEWFGATSAVPVTVVAAAVAPTIAVSRLPSPMKAGQAFDLTWSSTNATAITRVCSAAGTGYVVNDAPPIAGGSGGTAQAAWVNYPSHCVWTASGPGGSTTFNETMTTVAPTTTETVTYLHTDGLGSPVARSDAAGNVTSVTRYEPYGLTAAGATPTVGFAGHVNDSDTGLVYMQQRYYDPVAGRFLSIDPVVTDANSGSSFNRYSYANNSPYRYLDPDGRNPEAAVIGTIVLGGAIIATISPAGKKAMDSAGRSIVSAIKAVTDAIANATSTTTTGTQPTSGSAPPAPGTLVGEQGEKAGETKNGKRHTSGPLTPGNGGTGDANKDFDKLTGGTGKPPDSSDSRSSIPGVQIGDNGVWIRPDGKDGPRIEIPAAPGKLPETLHYPPEKK